MGDQAFWRDATHGNQRSESLLLRVFRLQNQVFPILLMVELKASRVFVFQESLEVKSCKRRIKSDGIFMGILIHLDIRSVLLFPKVRGLRRTDLYYYTLEV